MPRSARVRLPVAEPGPCRPEQARGAGGTCAPGRGPTRSLDTPHTVELPGQNIFRKSVGSAPFLRGEMYVE